MIGALAAFVALTAIGGGLALLAGADKFPIAWLNDTPFSDFTIPALLLTVVVGGSMLVAAVTSFTRRRGSVVVSMGAGLIMVGFISVEVLILKQTPPGPTWIEGMYFGLGVIILGLGIYLWRGRESSPV